MKQKTNQGITLIALIITVIVMLILAAVAINLTIGDNGIFKKSEEGAQIYKNAANNEATSLNNVETEMGSLIDKYKGGNGGGIYTKSSTINGEDSSAFNPMIPKGFKPVDVDDAKWGDGTTPPTEEAVKKGLVIEDGEGNQFVWIAVDGTEVKLGRYVFTETGEIDESLSKTGPTDQLGSRNYTEGLEADTTYNAHARDIQSFIASVTSYGGYYIARYESSYGIDEKPNSKVSTGTLNNNDGEEYAPTQEGQLWNNITQSNAVTACQNMYDSSYGVTSDLVNSYAWGTAIVFIQKYSGDTDYSRQTSLNAELANTGNNGDEKCHIHDMASNCTEWTTETAEGEYYPCTGVGGGIDVYSRAYTSERNVFGTDEVYKNLAFRPLLYIKDL